jgi:sulfonate transport system substrate-binding protein
MTTSIKIGLHSNNPTLSALSGSGILENRLQGRDAEVEWFYIAGEAKTVDYVGAGLIDVGATGVMAPINAQAKGIGLVYIATSESPPVGGILVREDSPVRVPADLRGKRIALGAGTWHQHLLAVALDQADVRWSEIVPLDIPEPLALKALHAGGIDAWATGADNPGVISGLRFVARTEDLIGNPSVFFARGAFAEQNPELLDIVVQSLDAADRWIQANLGEAVLRLAGVARNRLDATAWKAHVRSRPQSLVAVDDAFLDRQQHAADLFHRFGILPHKVNVHGATLAHRRAARRAA